MKNTAPYQRGKGLEAGTRIGQKPAGVVISKTAWRLGGPTERRIMVLNGLIVIPMFTYIVVFLVLHPYLGGWAWVPLAVVVMPASIYCWVAYARRTRAQYVRAETEGFPLASLYPWGWRRRKNAERPPGL